ncbi:NAD(P)(+) transhydrogenase (Re/Si-specific) subunit beta [Burkholderia sp. Ac-20365]|nr:NAD(P)(+) transhydrogenase (Re/Si-specific) subunit beta [Burkholderia sp. Ac-20365]
MAAGYAGIDDDLFYMDKTMIVFGVASFVRDAFFKQRLLWINSHRCVHSSPSQERKAIRKLQTF